MATFAVAVFIFPACSAYGHECAAIKKTGQHPFLSLTRLHNQIKSLILEFSLIRYSA